MVLALKPLRWLSITFLNIYELFYIIMFDLMVDA
jgi:hypothetical protein